MGGIATKSVTGRTGGGEIATGVVVDVFQDDGGGEAETPDGILALSRIVVGTAVRICNTHLSLYIQILGGIIGVFISLREV